MSDQPSITKLVFQRNASSIGIGQSRPTLSWRYAQTTDTVPSWKQLAYEVKIARLDREPTVYQIESSENVELDWPKAEADLASRERVKVSVRALGQNAANLAKGWTDWYTDTVEAALLSPSDWTAQVVGPKSVSSLNLPKRPFHLRKTFSVSATADIHLQPIRVYATALGVYQLYLNGQRIGDHVLAPGWQSYAHRLHYQTYTLPAAALHEGDNTLEAIVGEGWFAGRLSIGPQWRNLWGPEIGVMVQLEIAGQVVAKSDETWEWRYGSILAAELYDGEVYDMALSDSSDWRSTKTLLLPPATSLIPPEAPPIRQMESLKPVSLLTTPSGKKILDFGQNLVGWVKVLDIPRKCSHDDIIQLRFAEVLDNGELGVRPLRTAKCTDTIYLSPAEGTAQWEPTFTTHGFRYCEVTSPALMLDNWASHFEAVVVHSDVERLGDFECSHEMINQLHRNVVWSTRGNIVGLPTDCPQRDERLGWTGDIMLFAPTANYLYDMSGFLANWLHDLSEEQLKDNHNVPPMVVPNCLIYHNVPKPLPQAAWGDVCVLTPEALYNAYGSKIILREMWPSITAWLDKGIPRGENGLWADGNGAFQFGDWLDPRAPPNSPQTAMTDPYLVADAYLVATVQAASRIAYRLGFTTDGDRYETEHRRLRQVFQDQYISPRGRMASDSQAAYCLAYQFSLLEDTQLQGASERLLRLVTKGEFKIATGFVGTPALTHALLEAGHLNVAYRMLQEKGCPSWLYPLTKGATTVWERWDSIMEDDSINPGEMTSFNHYSLGAVANFLHTVVGGIKALEPGYRSILIQPLPGGSVTSATTYTITPYGKVSVKWTLANGTMEIDMEIPVNTSAVLRLGSPHIEDEVVGSGFHSRQVAYLAPGVWPPPFPPAREGEKPKEHVTLAE